MFIENLTLSDKARALNITLNVFDQEFDCFSSHIWTMLSTLSTTCIYVYRMLHATL